MTIGVVMPAVLPKVLNKPPSRLPASFGEISDTTAQPGAPTPLPKNASDIIATTSCVTYLSCHQSSDNVCRVWSPLSEIATAAGRLV